MKKAVLAASLWLQVACCAVASACTLPEPKGDVILVIDGMIEECNHGMKVKLDRGMIEALPHQQVKTENPWDHGPATYEGVLLRDLMKFVRADGAVASVEALNDYRSDIALADIDKYDVILAYKRDGVDLPVRDKGPLFVVFPFSDVPALATEATYAQSVWQVNHISVK